MSRSPSISKSSPPDPAIDGYAVTRLRIQFFRVYHSMRYVRDKLVFRLNKELHPLLLHDINQHSSDLLTSGEFTQRAALSEEKDEKDLAHLPRLVFRFNRRDLGRLRQLIDCINRGSLPAA